jgi:hypothetical protein
LRERKRSARSIVNFMGQPFRGPDIIRENQE